MTQSLNKNTSVTTRPKTSGNTNDEAIKVIVRCRPLSELEIKEGYQSVVSIDSNRGIIEIKNPKESNEPLKTFTFDAIYDWNSTQSELYDETFRDLVNSVLNGFNGTIFAYGQTGTGKTFTMEGIHDDKTLRGVIPNSFEHIFHHIANSKQQQYLVRASYLEIYQEEVRDLLNKDSSIRLELKERPDIGVYVKDLSSFVVKSVQEIQHVMSVGHANRSVGRTNMNEHSSRSHAIFMITVECCEVGPDGENHIRVGRLNLVDLAGSERQSKTGALGDRFKEATKINLSLSALGNVISALVDGKSSHIPYRDSKLTRLLQDSLGGNSKTVMVANIGPASYNFDETMGTLRYANRAKNIKNKPKINEDPKDALVREFQEEIARLKSMLEKRGVSGSRKRRNKKHSLMSESLDSSGMDQSTTLEYLEEQQRLLEEEQKAINENTTIILEEKQKLLEDLNIRREQLLKEHEAQQNLAKRIEAIQSKLLSGNSNLVDKTRKQEDELENKRLEIAEQKKREREILQQLESQECSTSEINQTFTTLKQEVELKTKKLKKLYIKYQQIRSELQDTSFHHSRERQDLETSVSEITKELKLKLLIVDNFIPYDVVKKLKERAYFDEDADEWHVLKSGQVRPKTSENVNNTRPFKTSTNNVDDATLSYISHEDSSMGKGKTDIVGNMGNITQTIVSRPTSRPDQRRSFSNYEQQLLNKARQRIQKSNSVKPTLFAKEENLVEELIPEEVLRFCGENILTFSCLETFPSIIKNYDVTSLSQSNRLSLSNTPTSTSDSTFNSACDVMIDVSRIPAPRRAVSRDSRKDVKNGKIRTSTSVSKKEEARSVPHSSQCISPMGSRTCSHTQQEMNPKNYILQSTIQNIYDIDKEKNNDTNIKVFNNSTNTCYLQTPKTKYSKENNSLYDSALSSTCDLSSTSSSFSGDSYLQKKRTYEQHNVKLQLFNRMTTSFTTPKPSKIPLLLSQSMSSVTSKNNQHKTLKTLLIQSTDSGNEITIGSSEQLAEVYVSPRITAENVLKNCREKKITISTKYSKPSLIVPLRRDYTAMEKSSSPKHYTNSFYLNEQSSGLGSSIVTMRSSIDEIEEKEIKDNVDKIMSFTRMRHSHKFYRNQMGGFDHDFLKNKNWLYLSARGFCRNCKHIPVFLMDYGKIKKYNVVKKRPCICEKLILSSKQNSSNLSTVKVEEQTNIIQLQSKMKTINQQELLFSVLNEHEIYEYFLLILLPGAFAFFVETFFSIITLL